MTAREVNSLDVIEHERRPPVFLQEADVDGVQLDAFRMTDEEAIAA